MAVDALRLFGTGHHQPSAALGLVRRPGTAMPMSGAAVPAAFSPCYGAVVGSQQQGYLSSSSSYMGLVHAPPASASAGGQQDQYTEFLADLAKRGVRLDGSQQMIAGHQRKRDDQSPVPGAASLLAAHAQQQAAVVVDLRHAAALAEQRKRHMGLIISTAEARAVKRLRAKDEEMERTRSVNWVLQERLRNLYVEAQMWRGMAQTNKAAAAVLRADLRRALEAQAARDVEDAGSCCWGDNHMANCGDDEVRTPVAAGVGRCKGCDEGAAVVLLLPCRHLCACASCAGRGAGVPGLRMRQEWHRLRQLFVMRGRNSLESTL